MERLTAFRPPSESETIALYRAAYLAGYEAGDAGTPPRSTITREEVRAMLAAVRLIPRDL